MACFQRYNNRETLQVTVQADEHSKITIVTDLKRVGKSLSDGKAQNVDCGRLDVSVW